MPRSAVIDKLQNPFPSIISNLVHINKQLAFALGGRDFSDETLGTVSGSRRNFKPFIIGFIPPDVQVNFIPFDIRATTVSGVSLVKSNGDVDRSGFRNINIPSNISRFDPSPGGEVSRRRTTFTAQQLRVSIAKSFKTVTGITPTEDQVGLIYSQVSTEIRRRGNSFIADNYNIGNVHSGGAGRYTEGPYGPWKGRRRKAPDGTALPPEPGFTGPPPNTKESIDPDRPTRGRGRHFIGSDADGSDNWYPTPYVAYKSLEEATNHQVSLLARVYPNTLRATDPKSYNSGLKDFGSNYYEAPRQKYEDALEASFNAYKKKFGNDPLGGDLTISGDPVESSEDLPSGDLQDRHIMASGVFTGNAEDLLSDNMGRGIVRTSDAGREGLAREQMDNLRIQIDRIQKTPPLLLLINPSNFARSFQPTVDSSAKTRFGNIVQQWMEKPVAISCSGSTAAQYVVNSEGAGGITNTQRVHSLSYQNLLSLVGIYKNNGMIFHEGGRKSGHNGVTVLPFSCYIYYDNHIYIGSFETMSVKDDALKPHNMSYDFKFDARYYENIGDSGFFDSSVGLRTATSGSTLFG